VVDSVPVGGVVVAPSGAYKGVRELLAALLASRRLAEVRLVDITDTEAVLAACDGASLLWVESPTNPLLEVADVPALCGRAVGSGVPVAVDNTFASPLLQRPLELGATWSVHSATKILSGHSDVVLGVVVVSPDDPAAASALLEHRTVHGAIPGPMEVFLALRGLRTLPVRLERASASAAELARRLAEHPAVARVRYPGWGFMLGIEVAGGADAADRVCEQVRVAVHATSLGGVETTLERRGRYAGEEATPPGLLRISVGLEHVEDLWTDLTHALH
jgi:cystathionine gamma-synthase